MASRQGQDKQSALIYPSCKLGKLIWRRIHSYKIDSYEFLPILRTSCKREPQVNLQPGTLKISIYSCPKKFSGRNHLSIANDLSRRKLSNFSLQQRISSYFPCSDIRTCNNFLTQPLRLSCRKPTTSSEA